MNLTFQSIVNSKIENKNISIFQKTCPSGARFRLNKKRKSLNQRIKPFDKISFRVKNVSFDMIYCPEGIFTMGDVAFGRRKNQKIERIDHPFLLGETEVTQELYQAVMACNPMDDNMMGYNPSQTEPNTDWIKKTSC
jgi:formylglycine-generating enzyme required for sulfatase activity